MCQEGMVKLASGFSRYLVDRYKKECVLHQPGSPSMHQLL